MRLKARKRFKYGEATYSPEDLLDAPDDDAMVLINLDYALRWHLEDPKQLSDIPDAVAPPETMPDVPPVTVTPTSASPGPGPSTDNFWVAMTGPGTSGTWTVDKDATADWLTYSPVTPQSKDGRVSFSVTANTDVERVGHFYINGQTFTVTQAGGGAAKTKGK